MSAVAVAFLILPVMILSSPHYGIIIGGVNLAFIALLIPCIRYSRRIDIKLVMSFFLFVLAAANGIYQVDQNCGYSCSSFAGALNPVFYSIASGARYFLAFYIYYSMRKWQFITDKHIDLACRFIINYFFFIVLLQTVSYSLGYPLGGYFWGGLLYDGVRYDALFGEPSHVHSWLVPAFIIYSINRDAISYPNLLKVLALLVICFSLAWLTALIVFLVYYRFGARGTAFIAMVGAVVSFTFLASVIDFNDLKYVVELSGLNERTITYFAGWEMYAGNWLFGYGVGATPYLLPLTDWFSNYPSYDLSEFGRQNVMSTPLAVLYEFGLVGTLIIIFLLVDLFRDSRFRSGRIAFGIMILPYFFVGSGLVASPFIYSFIGLYFCNKTKKHDVHAFSRPVTYQSNSKNTILV